MSNQSQVDQDGSSSVSLKTTTTRTTTTSSFTNNHNPPAAATTIVSTTTTHSNAIDLPMIMSLGWGGINSAAEIFDIWHSGKGGIGWMGSKVIKTLVEVHGWELGPIKLDNTNRASSKSKEIYSSLRDPSQNTEKLDHPPAMPN